MNHETFSQMCQCESSVAPSDHPDGNMHTKGSIFFYLVAICPLNNWWSFIVWPYFLLDCRGGGFKIYCCFSNVGHKDPAQAPRGSSALTADVPV